MGIETIIQIIQIGLVILSLTLSIIVLIKKKAKAINEEEKDGIDELILTTMIGSIKEIKSALNGANIAVDNKKIIKLTKKAIKEDEHGTSENE